MKAVEERNGASGGWVGPGSAGFDRLLEGIGAGAAARDADPAFPEEPFRSLASAGLLSLPVPELPDGPGRRATVGEEWRVLRAVAAADGSVGRILDGHYNAVERLTVLAPSPFAAGSSRRSPPGSCAWGSGGRPRPRRGRARAPRA
ncbi:hypothetical protein GBA65_11145 [Rubrobacter marinus]|uniref:Acyl-CoA dehydrogenase/oxidase N-terminal domain-containing protein n=1 Tax=Rubrobacter marinus TaxID=2653852 RepID=A0A6G8PXY1_9ACTN|nr:acyl-CoA dehydrogenase family protein [Rubrobacter marinus]QIN78987.1 hypothetical protein GBA65_11145 [Rubrobacter marinus]